MRYAVLILLLPPMLSAQHGTFAHGYKSQDHGVTMEIVQVHSSPRCKHEGNCKWMIRWSSKKKAQYVDIALVVAGRDQIASVVTVPGAASAPLDLHNPYFEIPVGSIREIDFTLRRGLKVVGQAHFK